MAIIGAGLAGLTLANLLKKHFDITVYEKSRGVGGRMSTRYYNDFKFDHGAQFFTIKTTEFDQFLKPYFELDIIKPWYAKFVEIEGRDIINSRNWGLDYPHYVATPNMNTLCKNIATNIKVQLHTKVTHIQKYNNLWQVTTDTQNNKKIENFDWVITANPVKQALELLPTVTSYLSQLLEIEMIPCFALMTGLNKVINLPFDVACVKNNIISWISNNSSKPKRDAEHQSLVVMSTNAWAKLNLERDLAVVRDKLFSELKKIIKIDNLDLDYFEIHKWRYANAPKVEHSESYVDFKNNIASCGDWCIQGRVESAFTSAYNLYNHIISTT